jgi:hypothetical protein
MSEAIETIGTGGLTLARKIARDSAAFIEYRLKRGDSPKDILEAHNRLVETRPSKLSIGASRDYYARELPGHRKLSQKEVERVYDRLRKRPSAADKWEERRGRRSMWEAETRARKMAEEEGEPLPGSLDRMKAHDAGMKYRYTEDPIYRRFFEEGSA